jgi:hypothetical protein
MKNYRENPFLQHYFAIYDKMNAKIVKQRNMMFSKTKAIQLITKKLPKLRKAQTLLLSIAEPHNTNFAGLNQKKYFGKDRESKLRRISEPNVTPPKYNHQHNHLETSEIIDKRANLKNPPHFPLEMLKAQKKESDNQNLCTSEFKFEMSESEWPGTARNDTERLKSNILINLEAEYKNMKAESISETKKQSENDEKPHHHHEKKKEKHKKHMHKHHHHHKKKQSKEEELNAEYSEDPEDDTDQDTLTKDQIHYQRTHTPKAQTNNKFNADKLPFHKKTNQNNMMSNYNSATKVLKDHSVHSKSQTSILSKNNTKSVRFHQDCVKGMDDFDDLKPNEMDESHSFVSLSQTKNSPHEQLIFPVFKQQKIPQGGIYSLNSKRP